MIAERKLLLILFAYIGTSVGQDMRLVRMSVMTGWQFQCANTTCLPFSTISVLNIRKCQTACLTQPHCQGATFRQSQLTCQLFADVRCQSGNMLADINAATMITIAGSRVPLEPTTTTTTTSTSTTTTTVPTTSRSTVMPFQSYSSSVSTGSPSYCRNGASCPSTFYYAALNFDVDTSGTYTITSSSSTGTDIVGTIYTGIFYAGSPATNLVLYNDDSAGGGQFLLSMSYSAGTRYILVVTTFSANTVANFAITVTGPGSTRFVD